MSEEKKEGILEEADLFSRCEKVSDVISGLSFNNAGGVLIACLMSVFEQAKVDQEKALSFLLKVSELYTERLGQIQAESKGEG